MLNDIRYRFRALFRRGYVERELDDEIRFHLAKEVEKYERSGVDRAEAERLARLAFGGVENTKEASRDSRGTARIESIAQDLRYAMRSLRHQPHFTVAVVLTLALGIGANVALFSLLDALMLRTIAVPQPERLVSIGDPAAVNERWTGSPETDYVSYPLYVDVRDHNNVLSGLYANGSVGDLDVTFAGAPDEAEHPVPRFVSGNFFSVLQVSAALGRTFGPDEDRLGQPPVAVLSYDYFQRRFGGDRSTIGRVLRVNGVRASVVGVMSEQFGSGDIVGQPVDLWFPIAAEAAFKPRANLISRRDVSWLVLVGRLAPGVTLEQARSTLPAIEARAVRATIAGAALVEFNEDIAHKPIRVEPAPRGLSARREQYARALTVLMIAVILVTFVVCANVSNLMLARGLARTREMTVRMALGAGPGRLMQQVVTEATLLGAAAGALGLLASMAGNRLLLATVAGADRRTTLDLSMNARLICFTGGLTLLCLLLFAVAPAVRAGRVDLAAALRAQGRSLSGARSRVGRFSTMTLLVAVQIALAMVLVIGSGLLARSMQAMLRTDLGMDREHLVLAHAATSRTTYIGERQAALQRDLTERLRGIAGVEAVSYSEGGPFSGGHSAGHIDAAGFVPRDNSQREIYYDNVGPDYFAAMGARLLRGRDFTAADIAGPARVATLNETAAKYYFAGRDPLGRTVTLDSVAYTIIGVVRDVEYSSVRNAPQRRLYFPIEPVPQPRSFEMPIRVAGNPARFVEPVRRALVSADRTIPIEVTTLDDRLRGSLSQDALLTQVTTLFGVMTLVLSALGLYGITAYSTTQRIGEFGIRMALGAGPSRIARMVIGSGVRVAAAGAAIGLPIALLSTRLLRSELFGVSPIDVATLVGAAVAVALTAVIASYLPARRAMRVPPTLAIRSDA
jgi:predicted permease